VAFLGFGIGIWTRNGGGMGIEGIVIPPVLYEYIDVLHVEKSEKI
jgi:hypothetical protein